MTGPDVCAEHAAALAHREACRAPVRGLNSKLASEKVALFSQPETVRRVRVHEYPGTTVPLDSLRQHRGLQASAGRH